MLTCGAFLQHAHKTTGNRDSLLQRGILRYGVFPISRSRSRGHVHPRTAAPTRNLLHLRAPPNPPQPIALPLLAGPADPPFLSQNIPHSSRLL